MELFGKKISLTTQIFIAMILGAILGLMFGPTMKALGFIGTIWLNCVKMIVVPMVLVTIITGIISQKNLSSLGRIAFRIIAYYILTTLVATVVGLVVTGVLRPGDFANFTGLASKKVVGSASITVAQFFTSMFTTNMFQTFAKGNIVQTLIIAVMTGIAIMKVANEEHKETLKKMFNAINAMVFSLIGMVMKASPIGVFFLMADSFAKYGASIFTSMASLAGVYYLACLLEGGEYPRFVCRRLILSASEDVGLADPNALPLAVSCQQAVEFVGMPEGFIPLAETVVYLALARKSNASYAAYLNAVREVKLNGARAVPLHLRNPSTQLQKEWGYGKEYKYPHNYPDSWVEQSYLPPELEGRRFYQPRDNGEEPRLSQWWRKIHKIKKTDDQ